MEKAKGEHAMMDDGFVTRNVCRAGRTVVAAFAIAASAILPMHAATAPASAVSTGVNIVSAGSKSPSTTNVALETRYRTSALSNFIDMITEKLIGFIIIVR